MGKGQEHLTRRTLLKLTGQGFAAIYLGGCTTLRPTTRDLSSVGEPDIFPIDRTLAELGPKEFSGDSFTRPHAVLWDTKRYLESNGGMPRPTEKAQVVIVGGGMSGLLTAYLLRDLNPLVLEQASRLGGNSRAESWRGVDYSLGAAYLAEPEKGSDFRKVLEDIGVASLCRAKDGDDPIIFGGKRFAKFWDGEADPRHREPFARYRAFLRDVLEERNGERYPNVPFDDKGESDWIYKLDRVSLKAHLEKKLGGSLNPQIATAVERYCWSSFNACADEISAASGLNFLSAETGKIWVPPGGNAAIAEGLARQIPVDRLRTNSVVASVQVKEDSVVVAYENAQRELKAVEAGAVVMACPKFVAKHLLPQLESNRVRAMEKARYRAYLVANVLLKRTVRPPFYDLFFLGNEPAAEAGLVDAVLADFAKPNSLQSVLTLYRAMPFEGSREGLYRADSYARYRAEFEKAIEKDVLPVLGLSTKDVVDVRLTRWGHPIPVAETGRIADRTVELLRAPFRDRVFFVEQDNWLLPAIETIASEAFHFLPQIRKAAASTLA